MTTPNSSDVAALLAEVDALVARGDLATLRTVEAGLAAAVARKEHGALLAAETAQYGRPVSANEWARTYESGSKDGGDLVSTLIAGSVVYQIHHVRLRDLT